MAAGHDDASCVQVSQQKPEVGGFNGTTGPGEDGELVLLVRSLSVPAYCQVMKRDLLDYNPVQIRLYCSKTDCHRRQQSCPALKTES